jgi:hypothetical protein
VSVFEPLTNVFDYVSGSYGYARGDILYIQLEENPVRAGRTALDVRTPSWRRRIG